MHLIPCKRLNLIIQLKATERYVFELLVIMRNEFIQRTFAFGRVTIYTEEICKSVSFVNFVMKYFAEYASNIFFLFKIINFHAFNLETELILLQKYAEYIKNSNFE